MLGKTKHLVAYPGILILLPHLLHPVLPDTLGRLHGPDLLVLTLALPGSARPEAVVVQVPPAF